MYRRFRVEVRSRKHQRSRGSKVSDEVFVGGIFISDHSDDESVINLRYV